MAWAEPDWLGAATEVAVMVTVPTDGTVAGAVYKPVFEIVPQEAPLHPVPEMLQLTAVFVLPVTVAVNCCFAPVVTCAEAGVTETETEAAL